MSFPLPTPLPIPLDASSSPITRRLSRVSQIVLVLSGKGGVGKSSSTVQLALSLHALGFKIGVLDTDLTGPSIPRMFGLDGQGVHQSTDGWVPVYADGEERRLGVMSVGFLLKSSRDSVVWRGPKKEGMIKQFLGDVRWGELDFLLVDTPPGECTLLLSLGRWVSQRLGETRGQVGRSKGTDVELELTNFCPSSCLPFPPLCSDRSLAGTSDEHLSLMTHLHPLTTRLSSVIITTPQAVSLLDTSKSLSFTRKVGLPVLGLIENMSGYACPCCGDITYLFGQGGGEEMCRREGLRFLGRVPVESQLVGLLDATSRRPPPAEVVAAGEAGEEGVPVVVKEEELVIPQGSFALLERYKTTLSAKLFEPMAADVVRLLRTRTEQEVAAASA